MKRRALIALLTLGVLGGFAAGFSSLRCGRGHGGERGPFAGRAAFERHVADLCTEAALRVGTK